MPERRTTVVIVGAGLAGLTAARQLHAQGVEVLVLEARDRVGGRTYTVPAQDGTPIDLGGQWIGPGQERIAALAEAVGVTSFPTYDTGNNMIFRAGARQIYSGAIPLDDPASSIELVQQMLVLNMLALEVPLEAPWSAAEAAAWDAQTVETWLEQNVPAPQVREVLTLGVRSVFGVEPSDLSLLHFLFYIHSAGNLNTLVSVTRGAQERHFHEGAQGIANKVATALGERVILNAPIHTVIQDERGVRVIGDTLAVTAERAILAIPPVLAGRLRYQPAMPALRDQLTQRMPMGSVIKVQCLYPTPFWRDEGWSGQIANNDGLVSITFDNTAESGAPGVLLGFVEGKAARIWGERSLEERRQAVIACLVNYFGQQAARPAEYLEKYWAADEYARGCYSGYMPPGVWTSYGRALREPVGRVHWAGTETATIWNGYMDGAVQSGERAADEALKALEGRSAA
ncbi:MAG TPA: flavin monoamine oxidase family protein [Ktedonobacterales bacterium]|nr:flavin monoamine oxidase family protein [Ktedonobacterales bacterium]